MSQEKIVDIGRVNDKYILKTKALWIKLQSAFVVTEIHHVDRYIHHDHCLPKRAGK
jgi:hypothetical protein